MGHLHELEAGFAASDHLKQQEQHMATVQSGNGQQVHHCQNNGDKGSDVRQAIIERMPKDEQLEYIKKSNECHNLVNIIHYMECYDEVEKQYPEISKIIPDDEYFPFDIDNAEAEGLFITYINKDAFAKQKKYLEEEEQRKIDEQKAKQEQLEKAKEDKIKNFKL